ncbi:hypothetical protein [Mycolicibacterium phocaicum]|uniref:Uncharacterized protein n=1 Tax=Mycolicibacterium phocaicum TaxID=319706 RepID=A0A7I7ZSS8_9MYCO|nr:hypothetical protein [Mycolicibacterium phocaicum]TLH59490.1 hypothetical protein C1S79_27385 [Mycolicibacterium phocaicum]UCZ60613.1 hypothetical protein LHJ73_29020 [Mycolicibacterium phocaicum]BBZ56739.1 hypothetical protein MPHO_37310 [Mycolicibacterium phocaicum]
MTSAFAIHSWRDIGLIVGGVLVIMIGSLVITPLLVRRGLKTPAGLRLLNRISVRAVQLVKRPITIMVLDEVIDVIKTGHYTRNISNAIEENHDELKALAAEKIRSDSGIPVISRIPGYDKVVGQASESVMHVLIAMLADPRMDEFVSDLLRNNLEQIQSAVRRREHERAASFRQAGTPAAAVVSDAATS